MAAGTDWDRHSCMESHLFTLRTGLYTPKPACWVLLTRNGAAPGNGIHRPPSMGQQGHC